MLDPQPTDSEQVSLLKIASRVGATVSGGEFPYVLWQKIVLALGGAVNGMENKHTLVRKAAELWGANVDGSEFESVLLYKSAVALGATVDPGDESEWLLYLIASNVGSTPTPTLPALLPVTNLAAADSGNAGLVITWADPASAPNGIYVQVKQSGVTLFDNLVSPGAQLFEVPNTGAGTFDVYATNQGDGVANSDSVISSVLGVVVSASVFNPSTYGTVSIWLKADALSLNDGDLVASWTDSSGQGNNLGVNNSSFSPVFKGAILNGKPVVRFDGVDDQIQASFTLAQPSHVFIVARYLTTQVGDDTLFDGVGGNKMRVYRTSETDISVYAGTAAIAVTTTPQSWHVFSFLFSGESSYGRVDSVSGDTFDPGTSSGGGLVLGSYGGGDANSPGAACGNVDIAEVLVYDSALNDTNREAVETYLTDKYAL